MNDFARLSLRLLAVLLLVLSSAAARDRRPNILVILFDDVGFSGLGAYGGVVRTPRIDSLAKQGTSLSRYYTSPFCGPRARC